MAAKKKGSRQLGTWLPIAILQMECLSGNEKLLYAYIYSFGGRGCWQTDEDLGKKHGRSSRSIQTYLASLKKAELLYSVGDGSKFRKLWAKTHPQVKAMLLRKNLPATNKHPETNLPRRNLRSTPQEPARLPRRNLPATNTYTIKNTIKQRGGLALPAEGQPNAPLTKQERLKLHGAKESLANFGSVKPEPKMSAADRATKAKKMLEQLNATEKMRTTLNRKQA